MQLVRLGLCRCRHTDKSTGGCVIMLGKHSIKNWSSTQKTIALSSEEADFTAAVRRCCEAIGILRLAKDRWMKLEGEALVSSSAALGEVKRKDSGKLRHFRVSQRWVQEKAEAGKLRYREVKRADKSSRS